MFTSCALSVEHAGPEKLQALPIAAWNEALSPLDVILFLTFNSRSLCLNGDNGIRKFLSLSNAFRDD